MSFREYLHEKAEESRHNETCAYLMFLAGTMFFVGGILETLTLNVGENPRWLIFIPYYTEPFAGAVLGLTLIVSGLSLIVFGIVAGLTYSRNRSWYMEELRKANYAEDALMHSSRSATNTNSRKKRKVKAGF
jgi:hypothetical protein